MIAVLISVTMQLSVIYLPVLQAIFKTAALVAGMWIVILIVAGGPSLLIGLVRAMRSVLRRRERFA